MIELDVDNHLVSFAADATADELARACAARGWFFPGPTGDHSAASLLRASPLFGDAFVARARYARDGVEATTVAAPRSATGPDLLGGLLVGAAEPTRLWVRVFDKVRAGLREESHPTAADLAARFAALNALGRDFLVAARARTLVVVGPKGAGAPEDWHDFVRVQAPGGRGLNPADEAEASAALDEGRLLLSAPFLGRAARLDEDDRPPAGVAALVQELRR